MSELVLLNFQPIQIQMLQGFVFQLGKTGRKEKSVAEENSVMKLVRGITNIIVSGRRQAGRNEKNCDEKYVCIICISLFTNTFYIITHHL